MNHRISLAVVAATAMIAMTSASAATLIGDTVDIGRYINGVIIGDGSVSGPFSVVVQGGLGDNTAVSSGNNLFVNVEADTIRIVFGPADGSGGQVAPGLMTHEILVEDIDWVDDAGAVIAGISLMTNFPGLTLDLLRFGTDFVGLSILPLDWLGTEDYFAEITLQASTPDAVPEPASLALLGAGLAGLAFARRKAMA